jgi:isopentenyl phosphate kinase
LLTFLKLGGSLLTDKAQPRLAHHGVIDRVAQEISTALLAGPSQQLIIGHGSGSFGHSVAKRWSTQAGVHDAEGWGGYAETAVAAAELSRLVASSLSAAGIRVLPIQPSASARCVQGRLCSLATTPLIAALDHGLVPLVYGDVALDDDWGGTIISTEEIFCYLARLLRPQRILLAGDMPGVLSRNPSESSEGIVLPVLTHSELESLPQSVGGARGMDVTGGMLGKVRAMLALIGEVPGLTVDIFSGQPAGNIERALTAPDHGLGTRLSLS